MLCVESPEMLTLQSSPSTVAVKSPLKSRKPCFPKREEDSSREASVVSSVAWPVAFSSSMSSSSRSPPLTSMLRSMPVFRNGMKLNSGSLQLMPWSDTISQKSLPEPVRYFPSCLLPMSTRR